MKQDELLNNETVRQQIAERAYFLSESNGFAPGRETEFWLAAEAEILTSAAPVKKTTRKAAPKAAASKTAVKETSAEAPKPAAPRKKAVKKVAA